ncbi:MAG: fimbria/pilus periplasmic chaperone [Acidobacteria bacterium]|nr:fimbria/pilus periplasmic chaperone [Acidobacteriota bacterium]
MPNRSRFPFLLALAFTTLWFAAEAEAGQFGVSPLRLNLGDHVRDTELTLTNQSDRPLNVQARAMRWTQDAAGNDVTEEAGDLVLFPRITEIPVGESRSIRIALRGSQPDAETAYRVFVEELPSQAAANAPVQFTLQVSVPLFLRSGPAQRQVAVSGARFESGNVLVDLANTGNTFSRMGQIEIRGVDAQGGETFRAEIPGWYLLTGTTRAFAAPVTAHQCRSTAQVEIAAHEETFTIEESLVIAASGCAAELTAAQ